MPLESDGPFLEIAVNGREDPYPSLTDVSLFLWNFNLLYEFCRITVDPRYQDFSFELRNVVFYDSPLASSDRLSVVRLRHESPLLLVAILPVVVGAPAAVLATVQLIQNRKDRRIDRKIKELDLENKQLENEKLRRELTALNNGEPLPTESQFRHLAEQRGSATYIDQRAIWFEESPIQVQRIGVRTRRKLPQSSSQ